MTQGKNIILLIQGCIWEILIPGKYRDIVAEDVAAVVFQFAVDDFPP